MNTFPIYDTLCSSIDENVLDLTTTDKTEFIALLRLLNQSGIDIMYALIRYFQIVKDNNTSIELPYGGVQTKDDIKFDLERLPIMLKHILFKFIKLHLPSQTNI